MKRLLQFNVTENSYIILESGKSVFEIPFQGLRFDSRAFYRGIYAEGRSANIELENVVADTKTKAAYVYKWLNDIIREIRKELGEEERDIQEPVSETLSDADTLPETKTIILFDMGVCAGIGDFMGSQDSSGEPFETTELEADYALRISGHSMETTLADGSIVLVKASEEATDGQIVVVNVDGKSMVKRDRLKGNQAILMPDNNSGEYESILIDDGKDVRIQGVVLPC
jgi:SOS-response transcriptional repressors (RecA-mediated autopeptidases)